MIWALTIVYSVIFIVGVISIAYFIIDEFKNNDLGSIIALFFVIFIVSSIFYIINNIQTDKEFLVKKCIEHNITLPKKYKNIIKNVLKDSCIEKYIDRE